MLPPRLIRSLVVVVIYSKAQVSYVTHTQGQGQPVCFVVTYISSSLSRPDFSPHVDSHSKHHLETDPPLTSNEVTNQIP
jgi:hypothetical protein